MFALRPRAALPLLIAGLALLGCPSSSTSDAGRDGGQDAGPVDAGWLHVASPVWEEQIIYFIFTDRFANGDPSNDNQDAGEFDPANKDKYSGGDLQGIIDHLDYIQGLGATAIWITPPVANMWWDPEQGSGGYHGYWARNLKKVDEHLGTLATYQALSTALHQRGMYLIQDVVPNHMGNFFTYTKCDDAGMNCTSRYDVTSCAGNYLAPACDVSTGVHLNSRAVPTSKPDQAPFDQNDPTDPAQRDAGIYHWTPQITDYNNPYQVWYWALSDLDDLNSENPVVRQALRDSYGYWIKEVGVDGFRVDTAKYVPHDFWNDFFYSTDSAAPGMMNVAKATGRNQFHAFGEVSDTSNRLTATAEAQIATYLTGAPQFPAILAYPLFGEISGVFAQGNPSADMTYRLQKFMDPALNPSPYLTPTFIDNHDQSRFLSVSSINALLEATVFIFTIPGIPTVYYGTEQGFTGTRQAMFDGGYGAAGDSFNPAVGLYQIVKQLADLRKAHPALTHGTLDVLADNPVAPGALVYRRKQGTDTILVFMNTSERSTLVSNMPSGLPAGTVLENVHTEPLGLTFHPPLVGLDGGVTVKLSPREVLVTHVTDQVVAPGQPAAVITVTTALEGKTFTADTTIAGTVTPSSTVLKLLVDGVYDSATPITVNADGTWSTTLAVSQFPVGKQNHTVTLYASDPAVNVASPTYHLVTDVPFDGTVQSIDDPPGDDHGPTGYAFTYPADTSFNKQMDITNVTALTGATTMKLQLTMANVTNVWSPDQGFDHVVFDIYFHLPGQVGNTALPFLSASGPAGFTWSYGQFSSGYKADNKTFSAVGADSNGFGQVVTGPKISVAGKAITFEYDRTNFGLATWTGVQVYVTTWDFDGVQKAFRSISQAGGSYVFGHGNPTDPHLMDDVPPFTLTGP